MEQDKEKEQKKEKKFLKKNLIILMIVLLMILITGVIIIIKSKDEPIQNFISIKDSTTIEGEKLVFKSTSEYNRIIEYIFENNILKTVKIYQQFENSEDLEKEKEKYLNNSNITILNINEEGKSIEIQKNDFDSDTGKSYEEIYDKYLVQIIGAYEVIY